MKRDTIGTSGHVTAGTEKYENIEAEKMMYLVHLFWYK